MRIIDAHHHYWDLQRNPHPWLIEEPMIPFRYGDYSAIRRTFLPSDYDEVAAGWDIAATVTMEGEWDPADPVGEAEWMQALADETGRPAAHAAQAWLDRDDLALVLRAYDRLPIVRAVRHKPRACHAPGGSPGGMTDTAFQAGAARVADHGLIFELQTPWWHLCEAEALREAAPDMPIVLNHSGLPSDRSPEGLVGWREAMRQFAALPLTWVKISGLGLADRPWRIEDNRGIIRDCVSVFGPDRAMFASNFPVDGLCGTFNTIWSGFDAATADFGPEVRTRLFYDTAASLYRI